jgi:hypothetical protein
LKYSIKREETGIDHSAVQVISRSFIICESRDSACLCENRDNSSKLQPEPVSMFQFTVYERRFGGYLVNQPLYFLAVITSTQKSKKKRLLPAVNARKYLKPPHNNICCVLLLTNWYIRGSAFIYWLMSAKHSSFADNMIPNNSIVKVKCQNWFQKGQPKENYWRKLYNNVHIWKLLLCPFLLKWGRIEHSSLNLQELTALIFFKPEVLLNKL